eukprot:jgi/Tetstr1/444903/TSEL_003354.t1
MAKLSLIVAGTASLFGLKAFLLRRYLPLPLLLALGQTTAVGYIVAAAASNRFAGHTTGLLGKTPRGGFRWWSYPVWWPYHLGLTLKLAVQQSVQSEDIYNPVGKGWYIGSWPRLPEHLPPGEVAVLDCTCELAKKHDKPYLCLPTWDCQGPSSELISLGMAWAADQQRRGREVLVHCAHGHGRSCTVLCAALINEGVVSNIDEALAYVQRTRPKAKLNPSQRRALEQWLQSWT